MAQEQMLVSSDDLYRKKFNLQLLLTRQCNLNCLYCFYSKPDEWKGIQKILTVDQVKYILNEVSELLNTIIQKTNMKNIFFSVAGGEPLLNKHLLEILKLISSEDYDIYLYTNGTLINKEIAEGFKLLQRNNSIFLPILTLDSHIKEIHETTRNNYDATISSIKKLKNENVSFAISSILNRYNKDTLVDSVKYFVENYSKSIHIGKLRPAFKIPKEQRNIFLAKEEIIQTYSNLLRLKQELSFDLFHSLSNKFDEECKAGYKRITIGNNGDIYPCDMINEMIIGNIFNDRLSEIYLDILKIRERQDPTVLLCETQKSHPYFNSIKSI